jgi:hypothetical protein
VDGKMKLNTWLLLFILFSFGCNAQTKLGQKSKVDLTSQKEVDYFNDPSADSVALTLSEIAKLSREFIEDKHGQEHVYKLNTITVQKYFDKVWVARVEYHIFINSKLERIEEVMVSMDGNVLNNQQ